MEALLQTSCSEEFVEELDRAALSLSEEGSSSGAHDGVGARWLQSRSWENLSAPTFSALVQHCLKPSIAKVVCVSLFIVFENFKSPGFI